MFGLLKKIFIGLLTGLVNGSNHKKVVLLRNGKCEIQPSLINLNPSEYSQNYNTIHLQLNQIDVLEMSYLKKCVINKAKGLNVSVFNMITGKKHT